MHNSCWLSFDLSIQLNWLKWHLNLTHITHCNDKLIVIGNKQPSNFIQTSFLQNKVFYTLSFKTGLTNEMILDIVDFTQNQLHHCIFLLASNCNCLGRQCNRRRINQAKQEKHFALIWGFVDNYMSFPMICQLEFKQKIRKYNRFSILNHLNVSLAVSRDKSNTILSNFEQIRVSRC